MNDYSNTYSYSQHASSSGSPLGFFIFLLIMLAFYLYFSYSLYLMAKKTNFPEPWMAWVPILLNVYVLIKVAGKPGWWFFLLLVPLVNIIIAFVVWYNAALRVGKPGWLGVLTAIFPFLVGFLAFPKSPAMPPAPSMPTPTI